MSDLDIFDELETRALIDLTKLFDECRPTDPLAPYQADIRQWATTYLTTPHPELGREGPVCPYTAASISRKTFWVGCLNGAQLTAVDIQAVVADVVVAFPALDPVTGPDALLKTVLILFPGVTDYSLIDEAQRQLKAASVAKGLMIGQFYPGCAEPGIRNPEFRPLSAPLPLLAIRAMVSSDLPFLAGRKDWIEEYLKRFAPTLPVRVRTVIAEKFDPSEATLR